MNIMELVSMNQQEQLPADQFKDGPFDINFDVVSLNQHDNFKTYQIKDGPWFQMNSKP